MRSGRHLIAAALAGPLALCLVAATAPGAPAREGTASTTLSAVELAITSPLGDAALGLVDATTFASTSTDEAVNAAGVPFATAVLTPLTGPAGPVGRTEARSDGAPSSRSTVASLDHLGGPIADIAGSVAPATLTATASAAEAEAVVGALTAEIAGLASALGVTVETTDIASRVTAAGASATQGLQVSEVSVSLGDIVPQDVLASLPLPDLLAFLESLPLDLPADVRSVIDELQRTIDALVAQLGSVESAGAAVEDALADLEDATAALDAVTSLTSSLASLEAIDPALLSGGGLDGTLGSIEDAVGGAVDDATGVIGTVGGVVGLLSAQQTAGSCGIAGITTATELAAAIACVEGIIEDTLDAVDVGSVTELRTLISTLVTRVTTTVDTLLQRIQGLVPGLGSLATAAADLDDLLGSLSGLLGDAAALPLVSVSPFDLGIDASSDGTVEGSRAVVLCEPVTITVLGESLTTPGCDQGVQAVQGTAALVSGLLGDLTATLNVLPLTDVLTTGELRADLFSDLRESVVEEHGVVTATAGITALDLAIPSITIDPGPVTGLLDQLGLPDVLGTVEDLLADVQAQVTALALPALGTVTTTLATATGQLGAAGGVGDLVAQLEAILAGLDLDALGTLDSVSTPSLTLVVDPVSTASFSASGAAVPTDPTTGGPAPAPAPGPSLPATGGGLAVLGLATLAGAASLRRRG